MKTLLPSSHSLARRTAGGYALFIVILFLGATLLILSAALNWSSTNYALNRRNNDYFNTLSAAESATEKVLTRMSRDFQNGGETLVYSSLATYRASIPASSETTYWNSYQFSDGAGVAGKTKVDRIAATAYTPLQSQYEGLYGLAATYRITSRVKDLTSAVPLAAAVRQEIQVATIPIFQFAIWYGVDLEVNPGPDMTVTGKVHSNGDLFVEPQATLIFKSDVTAAGHIYHHKKPGDPLVRSASNDITYKKEHDDGVASMTLPIGTNNSPASVHAILEIPPAAEDMASAMGKERYYNKADMIILVSNSVVKVTSGAGNSFATIVPPSEAAVFLRTDLTFYNKRELKTIKTSQIDVSKLKAWSATNNNLRTLLGRDVSSIYIADMRSQTSSTESGVRLVNGQTLPSLGLTVSTPNPLYVQGHFNAPAGALGTTNTSGTKPASLVGDSINVLSTAWSDANSASSIGSRNANDTTINAAFLAGIVPTSSGVYSGGVENFPRFLEDWSDEDFTYNGSMVVMFHSLIATAPWGGSDVYSPPNRKWAFDVNFLDATKLPPGTPSVRAMIRGEWAAVAPGSDPS